MTEMIRNPHIQTLFTLAQEDETTLQFPLPDQIYGFHAQQACEKLLKALISANNRTYPFTHNLEKLADILTDCGETLPATSYDLLSLEPFAVLLRYDLGGHLSASDKVLIRESVAALRQHIHARILALEA